MASLEVISFDLWDTLVHDDSDESRRAQQGLRSKRAERRHLLWQAIAASAPIDYEQVARAYDVADAMFNITWKEAHVTLRLEQRLRSVLDGLQVKLAPGAFDEVLTRTARMEVDIPPDPIAGVTAALQQLAQRYRLAICSDAIVTPGAQLRELLDRHGLRTYFSAFAFSDEVGHSKPHRSMFDKVTGDLGVAPSAMVHIGDRDHNDVKGPQAIGARAILFTASRANDRASTSADAICESYAELPGVIEQLAAARWPA
ncbi:MAG: HAD family hydrolase [Rubrivivax sp.]|jgi:putative hydrolase of the HAD superfamily|nr:HAD family hydrolase [Rubrivivax sp.]